MEKEPNKSSEANVDSSTSLDTEAYDLNIPECSTHLSITTVLHYCKHKILSPYMRLLGFTGLRPLISDQRESSICLHALGYAYTIQVAAFMVVGYVLQYMACFRRDRGFCYFKYDIILYSDRNTSDVHRETCDGSLLFSFVVPGVLHLAGFLHAVFVFRSADDEQLPILMERVFIISTNLSNGFICQRKLVRTLWLYVIFSIVWLCLSFIFINYTISNGEIIFKWLEVSSLRIVLIMKILLVVCTLWQDIVQSTIISSYCLQAQLLSSYARFLSEKFLQYPVQPLEWMRDIQDFKKLLNYFNDKIAPSVCLLTIVNISCAISGLLWMLHFDHTDKDTLPIFGLSILNVVLWIFISLSPFVQAARLSSSCEVLKTVGQEARTRPYVHQDTPTLELDSVLLYTTSLKIGANLFLLNITGKKLCFCVTVTAVVVLVLGQCHYLISK